MSSGDRHVKYVETLSISVIMPVRNEAKSIAGVLNALLAQDYPAERFEILVVDGESTDDTPAIVTAFAERYPIVHLFTNPRRWSSAARNIGIRHAQGNVFLIIDGHCEIPNQQLLRNVASAFERSGADCLGRPQPLDVSGATAVQRAIAAARSSWLGHHPDSYIYSPESGFVPAKSVAVAFRRDVCERVGYFDEDFDACEDVEMNHRIDRAGLRCYFDPEIAVRYVPRGSLGGLFCQMVRYGRGRVRLLRKHADTLSLKTLLPGAFLLVCSVGGMLACFSRWLAASVLMVLVAYLGILLATSVGMAVKQRDPVILPWLPLVFATVHAGAGVGTLWEALFPRGPKG